MESAAKRGEDYLERATEHTLSLLARNRKGFFAMIEGSQIDGAGHGNNTKKLPYDSHIVLLILLYQ